MARDDLPKGMEVQVHTREGRQVWLHFSLIVVPHEPGPLMVHVVHDVSPHMRASEFVAQVASMWQANGVLRDSGLTGRVHPDSDAGGGLHDEEREVLRLMADGLSTKSIAVRLSVSPYTVRNHVQHLLAK